MMVTNVGSVAKLIQERRTVRIFKEDSVSSELMLKLLNIAVWAPTHNLREPWRFILFRDEGRKVFADAVFDSFTQHEKEQYGENRMKYYMGIPLHMVIIMKEDPRQKQWDEDYAAVCCFIQNFQLVAWEQGLGMVWKSNPYMYTPKFREAMGVQAGEKIIAILHVGYPEMIPPATPRTPAENLLTIIDTVHR